MNLRRYLKVKIPTTLLLCTAALAAAFVTGVIGPKDTASAASLAPQPVHGKWAVIVGCNQFQDPALAPLKFAVRNASELSMIFKDPNVGRFPADHVAVISGIHATKSGVEKVLAGNWLLKKALPNDLIFLYFCTRVVASTDDLKLCSYDTLASEADSSAISLAQMLKTLKSRTQSHRILCVLDTSPAVENSSTTLNGQQLSRICGTSFILANNLSSQSYESPIAANSFFVHSLIEAMKAGSGLATLSAVSQYLGQNLPEEVQKFLQKDEHPEFAVAADAQDLPGLSLGFALKQSGGLAGVKIGHRLDNLQLTRPDLARQLNTHEAQPASKPEDKDDDEDQPTADVDFGSYMTKMKQAIQKQWQPPKGFENRRVVTVFTIRRDGSIVEPTIVEGTGVESVDKAALDALHAASPLDPLPLGAPKSVQIRYLFDWHVTRNQ